MLRELQQMIWHLTFIFFREEMGATNELEETYALSSIKTLEEGVKNIIQYLGLQPCERSEKIPEGKSSHTLFLAGKWRNF